MLNKIKTYIAQNCLLAPNATVIVGLSGGMDSMAMLDVLTLLGYRCVAAHCNFHLRGNESDYDARFAKKWCKENDIEFTSVDFDTHQYAADKKISIEMAARELRYTWFEIVRQQFDAEAIAVAHHQDDSVETVLLNLVRGTGIGGLSGIAPKNGNVVRPMLCVTRKEIEDYITGRDIPFVSDSTNREDRYTRNFIRLNVLPMLQRLNPSVSDAIHRTSRHLAETEKIQDAYLKNAIKSVFADNAIHIAELKKTASPSSVLFAVLSPLGFHPSVIEDVARALDAEPGKIFFAEKYRLIKDRNRFLLDKNPSGIISSGQGIYFIPKSAVEISHPIHLKTSIPPPNLCIEKNSHILYADADKLQFPLSLRRWQQGDWFVPFGMKGRKKLSNYFTDRKFSLKDKENAWIMLSGDDIVWIVGERADNRFRISDSTKNVFMAEFLG